MVDLTFLTKQEHPKTIFFQTGKTTGHAVR